jgi:hypothetical protein
MTAKSRATPAGRMKFDGMPATGEEAIHRREPLRNAASDRERRLNALNKRRPQLVASFRRRVIEMAPGDRIHYRDMDAWAKTQWPYVDDVTDDPWQFLTIDLMALCGSLSESGWLERTPLSAETRANYCPEDDYLRSEKAAPKAGR